MTLRIKWLIVLFFLIPACFAGMAAVAARDWKMLGFVFLPPLLAILVVTSIKTYRPQ